MRRCIFIFISDRKLFLCIHMRLLNDFYASVRDNKLNLNLNLNLRYINGHPVGGDTLLCLNLPAPL